MVGETDTVMVGAVPEKLSPLLKVPEIVPVPVTVKVKLAALPQHKLAVPLMAAVGSAFTVTAALPVSPTGKAEQLASARSAMV